MENNRKVNVILSLVIAFCGWLYVMYNVDPTTTRVYKDIPITYSHEKVMEENGIAIRSTNRKTIEVHVQGRRSALNKIKDGDITARGNLSDVGKGENTVHLTVHTPSKVSVVSQSETSVTVNTEEIVTRSVPGRTEYAEETSGTTEPIAQAVSNDSFEVSGAKSLVKSVKYVRIPVEEAKLSSKARTYSVSVVPIDSKGDEIAHLNVSPGRASVTAVKGQTKTVALKAKVTNPDNDDYLRTYELPDTVVIKGSQKAVAKVDSITTENIDLSDVTESGRIDVSCVLPEGITLANDSLDLAMTVNVTKYQTKRIKIPTESITVKNLNSKYKVTFNDSSIYLKVIDTGSRIKDVEADDFSVSINANGLKTGEYELEGTINSKEKLHKVEMENKNIYVYLSKKD